MTSDSAAEQLSHGCVRCGRPVPIDIALCEDCNPLGLSQPASSQVHGTVFLAVAVAVVALALLGRFVLAGIGPFSGSVVGVAATASGLDVTLAVTNEGSKAGSTTCRVYDPADVGIGPGDAFLLSPDVPAGQTMTFTKETAALGATPRALAVDCTGP